MKKLKYVKLFESFSHIISWKELIGEQLEIAKSVKEFLEKNGYTVNDEPDNSKSAEEPNTIHFNVFQNFFGTKQDKTGLKLQFRKELRDKIYDLISDWLKTSGFKVGISVMDASGYVPQLQLFIVMQNQ